MIRIRILLSCAALLTLTMAPACGQDPAVAPSLNDEAAGAASAATAPPADPAGAEPTVESIPTLEAAASDPERVLLDFWNAFRADDREVASRYLTADPDTGEFPDLWGHEDDPDNIHLEEEVVIRDLYLGRMALDIDGHRIEGDRAMVQATVTWPDPAIFFSAYLAHLLEAAFSGASEDEINEALVAVLMEVLAETPDVSTPFETTLVLVDGQWKLTGTPFPDLTDDLELEIEDPFEIEAAHRSLVPSVRPV